MRGHLVRLPALALGIVTVMGFAAADPVAVNPFGDAHGDNIGISLTGDSSGSLLAVSGFGDSSSPTGVTVSGTGDSQSCGLTAANCVAVSGTGAANGHFAVSGLGDATICADNPFCVAVSGTGDSFGIIAVSGTGNANGAVAVEGCQSHLVPVSVGTQVNGSATFGVCHTHAFAEAALIILLP